MTDDSSPELRRAIDALEVSARYAMAARCALLRDRAATEGLPRVAECWALLAVIVAESLAAEEAAVRAAADAMSTARPLTDEELAGWEDTP